MRVLRTFLSMSILSVGIAACDAPLPPGPESEALEPEPDVAAARGASASETSKIQIGYSIAPVPLDVKGKNPALVGLGSYIVNAQADCAGCHSSPQYASGGDPHLGQAEMISQATYLSGGGTLFGPFVPRNITPDAQGLPAGLTLEEFLLVLNTGVDLRNQPPNVPSASNDILQIMPWPIFGKMADREKRAIYEYLRAIPCVGTAARCGG